MTYDEILQSGRPVVVMFYGAACAPCARLKPRLLAMAEREGFELELLNVSAEMPAARALGVRGVPSLVSVKNGQASVLCTGDLTDQALTELLTEAGHVG